MLGKLGRIYVNRFLPAGLAIFGGMLVVVAVLNPEGAGFADIGADVSVEFVRVVEAIAGVGFLAAGIGIWRQT